MTRFIGIDEDWFGPLVQSGEHILGALRSLLSCPEAFRPFVVIEVTRGSRVFVQFAGSQERGLLFDVPALGLVIMPCPTAEDGLDYALTALRVQGVTDDTVVRVRFESTRNAPGKNPAKA